MFSFMQTFSMSQHRSTTSAYYTFCTPISQMVYVRVVNDKQKACYESLDHPLHIEADCVHM